MNPQEIKRIRQIREDDAVSPVIATILMVAITVVLAGTLYAWASSLAESNTGDSIELYSFSSRDAAGSPTTASDDNLAVVTMDQGESTSWASLAVSVSVDETAAVRCANHGQMSGNCLVVETDTDDGGLWSIGESITIIENGVDMCNTVTCDLKITITNQRDGKSLGITNTVTEQGGDAVSTPSNPGTGGGNDGNDDNSGDNNGNDNGDDNADPNACSVDSDCMANGYCMNGMCVYDDQDMDGVSDSQDNCPQNANGNQADSDQDGVGDSCDATPFGPMTTYYRDNDGDTYGDGSQPTDAYNQPAGYVTNSDDCDDQDPSLNLLNSEGNCALEPEPQANVVGLIQTNQVTIVNSGGTKYVFNSNTYDDTLQYGLGLGTYTLANIPQNHPVAVLNNGVSGISYTGDSSKMMTMSVTGSDNDGTYDFYYGDVDVIVTGDFGTISLYCTHHGYMGGQDLFVFGDEYELADTTAPVITVLGDNPETVESGSSYNDQGAISDGGESVTTTGTVDVNTVGTYIITYTATDSSGNQATVTRTVNVVDTTAPVVTLVGASTIIVETGNAYVEPGATADGGETVTISGTVTTSILGTYTITYTATDASGNQATVTRTVVVVDTTAPVIALVGDSTVTIEAGTVYVDDGATATDNYDGDLTSSIIITNNVDSNSVGNYVVTYDVSDSSGNQALQLSRTVIVESAPNTPPNVADVTVAVDENIASGTIITDLNDASGGDTDADGSALTYAINSGNGLSLFDIDSATGEISLAAGSALDYETTTSHSLIISASAADGGTPDSATVTINVNNINDNNPSVDSISLTSSNSNGLVYSDVTLTCTPTTSDADGDTVATTTTWTADGSQIGTGSSITLTTSLVNIGDVVYCTVTPSDGLLTGTPVDSTSATVVNYAPVISSVTIDNTSPIIGDTLTCTSSASDAEGHTLTTTYTWYVNSAQQSPTSPTLDTTGLTNNDVIYCSASVVDSYGATATQQSSTVTVTTAPNNPPTISSVSLTPTSATVTSTMSCTPVGASDSDGDTITYGYVWFVNGQQVSSTSSTLAGAFTKGDSVSCSITPNDGTEDGATVTSNSVTIQNSAPVISSVTIGYSTQQHSSGTFAGDQLTCNPTGSSDVDGDSLTFSYMWYLNGASHSNTQSLDTSNMNSGDVVYCAVMASDGSTNSATVSSASTTVYTIHNINIQGMAFSPSTITISAGDIIIWTNLDNMGHTVTEDSSTPVFDSGMISNSQTYTLAGLGVGTYTYHCQPHPSMTGTIIVQ